MLKIGIAGCGDWSNTVLKEIKNNKNFNLESVFCRNYNSKQLKFDNSIRIYENIESFFLESTNDCIYVAGSPELNFKAVNLAIKNKIPLILEKPIGNTLESVEKIKLLVNKYNLIIIPNLTNYFSDSFFYLKNYVDKNFDEIKRIIIFEGDNGPHRKNIHPMITTNRNASNFTSATVNPTARLVRLLLPSRRLGRRVCMALAIFFSALTLLLPVAVTVPVAVAPLAVPIAVAPRTRTR